MFNKKKGPSVLSIHPSSRGYAFVLFEFALTPHDWGIKDMKKDVGCEKTITSIRELMLRYRPEVLVVEDMHERDTRRTLRVKRICTALKRVAKDTHAEVVSIDRKKVKSTFAMVGAVNKHDIAKAIASGIEIFAQYLPEARKAWQPMDRRMALFDAAGRALAYYYALEQEAVLAVRLIYQKSPNAPNGLLWVIFM